MTENRNVSIRVPVLARVEGEGSLSLQIENSVITELRLSIFEPPRYFEKFLEGKNPQQLIDVVARICGICPVAYQITAAQALEQIFQTRIPTSIQAMRRVFYCGEWLQSHALHIHLLAAPDFLGFKSAIEMAAEHSEIVQRGMRLQGLGNALIEAFGARSVHPVGVKAGGFYKTPSAKCIHELLEKLHASLAEAESLIQWTASLPLPDDQQQFTSVALRSEHEYTLNQGRIVSSSGLDIAIEEYESYFTETHQAHSTALYSDLQGEPYLVGPLARLNLNYDLLPRQVKQALDKTGISFPSQNMFHSMVARAAEIYLAIIEAIRLLENLSPDTEPSVEVTEKAGTGFGCSEAPRGLLWHKYELDESANIIQARIVPPTSQNQARIEEDLRLSLLQFGLENSDKKLRLHSEMVIRNYDPCISCATHFLKLNIDRSL